MVPEPVLTHEQMYNNNDPQQAYFSFNTNEEGGSTGGGFEFQGTAIYYKIYTNYTNVESANSSINSANSSNTYSGAAQAVISYGYQTLGKDGKVEYPLIRYTGNNRSVRIRLTNNSTSADYVATIDVSGNSIGVPRRNGDRWSFDFGRRQAGDNVDLNKIPQSGDRDTDSSLSGDIYYVDMYAVNMGYDETFTQQYGRVLHLGTAKIDAGTRDN